MNHKKTILFYINAIHDGGAERVILQLAHHFADCGYNSILVTSFVDVNEYPVPENVERISIETKEIKCSRLKKNYIRILKLRKLCKLYKPVALVSFMAEPNFRSILATAGLPIKKIVSVRNDPKREYRGVIGRLVGKHIIPFADGCVFQTEEAKAWFPKSFQKKAAVICNDVDRVFFDTEYMGGKDIVALGRLVAQKNHTLLIQAYAQIAEKYDAILRIYGIGPLETELRQLINDLGMQSKIKLMGLTDNAPKILSEARIFVLSSDFEGMPNALLEAMAIGVPSIATDCPCGGPKTVIKNGYNGLLVQVGNKSQLVTAMTKLLSNDEYRRKIGQNAKEESNKFKTEIVFKEWRSYIEDVINRDTPN